MDADQRPDTGQIMFRLFDMLGRSTAIRALDDALRASGVHPLLVPDAVKLTVIQLLKTSAGALNQEHAVTEAARLLAYCMLGHRQFKECNSAYDASLLDQRIETALHEGGSLDAKLVLLTLHSGLICEDVADRIDLDDI
jgi:hypothetical protein